MGAVLTGWCACVCVALSLLRAVHTASECNYGVWKLWSAQLRENPISAPPLLFDVDGDGYDDIVVPSFSGEVWSIHGENGHIVDNWPFYLEDRAFHAGPLVYDVNGDGILEFVLTTTDAEIVFVQTDNTLLHGETIKIPPLRVKRKWHQEDPAHIKQLANQIPDEQISPRSAADRAPRPRKPSNFTTPFSEFESRFGLHADPLFSRHEAAPRPSGVDPLDSEYIYVDPHVLATPTIADTNEDGEYGELVVMVSYFFDPYRYGSPEQMDRLNGLSEEELADFAATGVVVIDLNTGKVKGQRMLGITRSVDNQPGYSLATPTVVSLAEGEPPVIITGTAMGELHVMDAGTLQEREGFPILVDSVTAQVAVADVFGSGKLDLIVGDNSGILYCVDGGGKRVWERELDNTISAAVRLADIEGDGLTEVLAVTRSGDVWVLNGQTGQDHAPARYPIHLNSAVETSVLPIHLTHKNKGASTNTSSLAIVVPSSNAIYIVEASTGCVYTVNTGDYVIHEVVSGDVDPYSVGLELLAMGLDGTVTAFKVPGELGVFQEVWSMEASGESQFTHKASSFYFVLPTANISKEIVGTTFDLALTLHSNNFQADREFSLVVSIGREHTLVRETLQVKQRVTRMNVRVPTPPNPAHTFMTVRLCNQHMQCKSRSLHLKFNLHAEQHLKWFLCFPFLCVCCLLLWLHRNHTPSSLPTTLPANTRKDI